MYGTNTARIFPIIPSELNFDYIFPFIIVFMRHAKKRNKYFSIKKVFSSSLSVAKIVHYGTLKERLAKLLSVDLCEPMIA